jgi:hypothetical protein
MGNFRSAIDDMTADLRYELEIAWQQAVQQGNLYPLIEFYNRHEARLQRDYNLSLNEVMGFDPNKLAPKNTTKPAIQLKERDDSGNPLSGLVFERPKRAEGAFSIFSILMFAAGTFLIIKSFKK